MTWLKKPANTIIRFSSFSQKEISAQQVQSYDGKFKPGQLSEKGQLFVLAAGIDGDTAEPEAKEIVVRVMREVYYADPSGDIVTSLKNAFKDANKLINEIFREANTTHLGIACTSLVLTSERVYVAQVGDSSTYRITRQRLENVSVQNNERLPLLKKELPSKRTETRLALGVGAEVDPDVHDFPLRSGDCFLLCSDRLIDVGVEEIRQIVRSNTPRQACQKLVDSARHLGLIEQADVQVLWVSSIQPTPDSTGSKLAKIPVFTKATAISVGAVLILTAAFFQTVNLEKLFPENTNARESASVDPDEAKTARNRAEAAAFFEAGELDMALKKYREIQTASSTDSLAATRIQEIFDAYKDKAHLYYQNGYYSSALTFYQKALTLAPENAELANLIAACEKKLTASSDKSGDTGNKAAKSEPTRKRPNKKQTRRISAATDTSTKEPEQRPRLWNWSTLRENDAEVEKSKIRFLNSATRKRLLSQSGMTNFELQIKATVAGTSDGRFGVIVGYQTMQQTPYETYYLISFYPEEEFILQRYTNFKKDILATAAADPSHEKQDFSLKIICNRTELSFYCDDDLIFDWEAPEPIVGRIGLYVGPDTEVTFSQTQLSKLTESR